MKNFFLLSSVVFLFSCGPAEKQKALAGSTVDRNFQPDTAKYRLLKIIEGGWVNEEYIQALVKYKSPMIAAAYGLPIQQLTFESSNLNGDTLLNVIGRLNFNEGKQFDIVFYKQEDGNTGMKAIANRNDILTAPLLNYSFEGNDTILLLNFLEGKSAHTSRFHRQFRKQDITDEISLTAMEYFVNKNVFEGNWKFSGKTVSFSRSGQVNDFIVYDRYAVVTMDEHAASKADEISFYSNSSGITYAFTVNSNAIQLYEIKESDEGEFISRGKMIGELKRE